MTGYPKILAVEPRREKKLLVTFRNGIKKIYDCSPLLKDQVFEPLLNDSLFFTVKPDQHGYGVIWNEELDLSESELWINGSLVE